MLLGVLQIAQIVAALGTLVAVGCSLYVASRARAEVRADRRIRALPIIVFEVGGEVLSIERRRFQHRIGGCNPDAVADKFRELPADGMVIDNNKDYGSIRNIGSGPALDVQVEFQPHWVRMGAETFSIDDKKRREWRYSYSFNQLPAVGQVVAAGAEAHLTRIPTFIFLDFEDRISEAEGTMVIRYRDVAGLTWTTRQVFRYFNSIFDENRVYSMTFSDISEIPSI